MLTACRTLKPGEGAGGPSLPSGSFWYRRTEACRHLAQREVVSAGRDAQGTRDAVRRRPLGESPGVCGSRSLKVEFARQTWPQQVFPNSEGRGGALQGRAETAVWECVWLLSGGPSHLPFYDFFVFLVFYF